MVGDKARVAIVVNSPPNGVLAPRARSFARGLTAEFSVQVLWRESPRPRAAFAFFGKLRRFRPDVLYLIDLGYPAVIASLLYRTMASCPLVIETGDPLAELFWGAGRVGRGGYFAIRKYQQMVLKRANDVVVRGTGLKDYLAPLGITRVTVLPDGVDTHLFHPVQVSDLRKHLGFERSVSVGVMGTLNWSRRLKWGYGCELIDALTILRDLPVCGLVLGDGPGRRILECMVAERGLADRVRFLGHVSEDSLPSYINAMDICLSTQTNDWVGRSRTTAKLPLFMACGRFVLATRVGEAARVLRDEMLVDYAEGYDPTYPERLAQRIECLVKMPELLQLGRENREVAESQFDYDVLIPRLAALLRSALNRGSPR
jgi:glycosyltransferase involved in cell wall biosynthesis